MRQGLCNGTVSVRPSVCLSVPSIDCGSNVRRVSCCGHGGQAGDIDRLLRDRRRSSTGPQHGAQQQTRIVRKVCHCQNSVSEDTGLYRGGIPPLIYRDVLVANSANLQSESAPGRVRSDWIYLCRFPTACCVRNWQSSFAAPLRRDATDTEIPIRCAWFRLRMLWQSRRSFFPARYGPVSVCVCLSHYRKGWTNRAGF